MLQVVISCSKFYWRCTKNARKCLFSLQFKRITAILALSGTVASGSSINSTASSILNLNVIDISFYPLMSVKFLDSIPSVSLARIVSALPPFYFLLS